MKPIERARLILFLTIVLSPLLVTPAFCWEATLWAVKDGDTLIVLRGREAITVRLQGIDAPELDQEFGEESRGVLEALVKDRMLKVEETGRDDYGRTVAAVVRDDGLDIGHELVGRGMAWYYPQYSDSATLDEAERKARERRKGLWASEKNPVAPWEYRNNAGSRAINVSGPSGSSGDSGGPVQVREYQRKDGTTVKSHTRSVPGNP